MQTDLDKNDFALVASLAVLPFLIYWPVVAFPYLLMDDNWLLRGWSESIYPQKGFVTFVQGRPALVAMVYASAWLFKSYGEIGIQIMRAVGIAFIGISSVLMYYFTRLFMFPKPFRFLAAALFMTLPATQIIVADGTWLAAAIASALGAIILLSRTLTVASVACAVVLLWFSAATYQSCYFIAPALFVLTLHRRSIREAMISGAVIAGSFIVYYVAWRILYSVFYPGSAEVRYNPSSTLSIFEWPRRIAEHLNFRWGLLTNVWDIPNGFPNIKIYVDNVLLISLVAAGFVFFWTNRKNASAIYALAFFFACFILSFFVAEFPVLASAKRVISYTTFIGSTIVFSIVVSGLLSYLFSFRPLNAASSIACVLVVALGAVLASVSVSFQFAIPTWLEMRMVSAYVIDRAKHKGPDGTVTLCYIGTRYMYYKDSPDPAFGHIEFTWMNFNHEFYTYWHSRDVMDLHGLDSSRVVVLNRDAMGKLDDKVYPNGSKPVCEPEDFFDMSVLMKNDLFRRGIIEPARFR